jgi:hypothetical protein
MVMKGWRLTSLIIKDPGVVEHRNVVKLKILSIRAEILRRTV